MKRFSAVGGLLLLAMVAVTRADEKDLKELEGTYSLVSLEKEGKNPLDPSTKELIQKTKVTFKGDNFSFQIGEEEKKAKIAADSTKTPHTLDITPSEGQDKGKTFLGIYKVEKGELSIAFTEKPGDRPKEFKAVGEVMLLKMKKEEKK